MSAPSSAQLAKHSSVSVEHYTPHKIVESARALMGGIDLDPASCAQANAEIVKALRFHTREDSGLDHSWTGRVWCNPPGGKLGNASMAKLFWAKLVEEWSSGRVEQACFLAFNLEMLQTTQLGCGRSILSFPFCVPNRRIAFLYVDPTELGLFGSPGTLKIGGGPTHANVISYLPPNGAAAATAVRRFVDVFAWLGECRA